jgi:hypothetical protein
LPLKGVNCRHFTNSATPITHLRLEREREQSAYLECVLGIADDDGLVPEVEGVVEEREVLLDQEVLQLDGDAHLQVVGGEDGYVAEVDELGGGVELLELEVGPEEVAAALVDARGVHGAGGAAAREPELVEVQVAEGHGQEDDEEEGGDACAQQADADRGLVFHGGAGSKWSAVT